MAAYTTIDDPEAHFQANIHTSSNPGSGGTQAVTLSADTDMQPDLVWLKNRASSSTAHTVFDAVRGTGKMIKSDSNGAEDSNSQYGYLSAFNSDGFTLLGGSTNANYVAQGTDTYVAWCWKANGSGGAQTDGDIDTVRSTNTTSLFTVATYTGSGTTGNTIGHGLGVKPALYIIKSRDEARNWRVYHHKNTSAPETEFLGLNVVNATEDDAGMTNDTAPTTSLITLGSMIELNTSGEDYVMYAWGEVQGFSKFGSYVGNASNDGPFIYTGFKPAFVLLKNISAAGNGWAIHDNKRDPFNEMTKLLRADTSSDVSDPNYMRDHNSNGFKIRHSTAGVNGSGNTFIYAAFAEAPFVNSKGVPCNAR